MASEDKRKNLERRRLNGGRLLLKGVSPSKVARQLEVSFRTVMKWQRRLETGGLDALRERSPGRPAGLNSVQRARLTVLLEKGASSHGFSADRWTLTSIAQLIVNEFGVEYSKSHLSRILAKMGWTYRRLPKHTLPRPASAIPQWKRGL